MGWCSSSLLGSVPLKSTRSSTREFQVAVQSMFGVGVTCPIFFTNHALKSRASTANKRAGDIANQSLSVDLVSRGLQQAGLPYKGGACGPPQDVPGPVCPHQPGQ